MSDLPVQTVDLDAPGPWWRRRAAWLWDAVLAGEVRDHGSPTEAVYALRFDDIGAVSLPDGRVVAADPYVMDEDPPPFEQRVRAGDVPVVAVRTMVGEDHERVAALVLVAGAQPVTRWEMATVAGQDVSSLAGDGFFGYGVDAGAGSFGSPEAMRVAGPVLVADDGALEDPVSLALFADDVGSSSAVVVAPSDGAPPIAVCSSGWGDGVYPTWCGLAADDDVVVMVTDFLVAGDPYATPEDPVDETPDEPAGPPQRPTSLLRRIFGR
ncbi:DUF4241 domain-containing protein [Nocardioides oleivorans]|uniref:DUF4241 domain-containing protein n=1 Tax=Nocardioides oleivorans TaxID=273676 RepID=A0A4Q2RSK7_9ACTN|nr:DUF4241 domain-containing protein [Nocardioides oleivorans]RYB92020.1 DUF4241 domain-containing protein [Nocardioides oleivorans]